MIIPNLMTDTLFLFSVAIAFIVALYVSFICGIRRTQSFESATDYSHIAHLTYKLEASTHENMAIKAEFRWLQEENIEEQIADVYASKLRQAVMAVKMGSSHNLIAEQYEVFDSEANLIVSVHGISESYININSDLDESLSDSTSEQLMNAVKAAKSGATLSQILEQYELSYCEAELIISAYSAEDYGNGKLKH